MAGRGERRGGEGEEREREEAGKERKVTGSAAALLVVLCLDALAIAHGFTASKPPVPRQVTSSARQLGLSRGRASVAAFRSHGSRLHKGPTSEPTTWLRAAEAGEAEMPDQAREALGSMTITELKAELRRVGLPTNGKKTTLIARLISSPDYKPIKQNKSDVKQE
eukprot:102989-Hanusia_phi.AAC.1